MEPKQAIEILERVVEEAGLYGEAKDQSQEAIEVLQGTLTCSICERPKRKVKYYLCEYCVE